jgi:hypothetical protein
MRLSVLAAVAALAALTWPLGAAATQHEPWLGLNGNSATPLGGLDRFVERGVVYDRSGEVEMFAGETLAQDGAGLERSIDAGMIPVIPIEFAGYSGCTFGRHCLPTDPKAISQYARGFIATAEEVLERYPVVPISFEAINEPWGYGSSQEYAAFLALLMPLLAHSHVPLGDVYAGAGGEGWVRGLYEAQPQLRTQIQGWYLHPYAKERKPGQGMAEVPRVRAEMASGQDNLIVSEIGFCAVSIRRLQCLTSAASAADPADAARALEGELRIALADHRAGWLRAALVYSRTDGGWAMQMPKGRLTESGLMLESFAGRYG